MAEIQFGSEAVLERYRRCKQITEDLGDASLEGCLSRLKQWRYPIRLGLDFDKMSFTFREVYPQELLDRGYKPVCGGIIYHGKRDGFGNGQGPTFSVTLEQTEGYQIHT